MSYDRAKLIFIKVLGLEFSNTLPLAKPRVGWVFMNVRGNLRFPLTLLIIDVPGTPPLL